MFAYIVFNSTKLKAGEILNNLFRVLKKKSIEFELIETRYIDFSASFEVSSSKINRKPDFVLSIGGDGTLLYTARLLANTGTIIAGIDIGKLGFLMHFSPNEIETLIENISTGNITIEERMMLECIVNFEESMKNFSSLALNEIVVSRGKYHRLIDIDVLINGKFFSSYRADGIIVATPTGSTAYSLSALGPILIPTMENLIITPICPHSISERSVVLEGNTEITLNVKHTFPPALAVVDGQEYIEATEHLKILVRRSNIKAKIVTNPKRDFLDILKKKLNWQQD